jgi:dihydropteroate synthase
MSRIIQQSAGNGCAVEARPAFPLKWGAQGLEIGRRTLVMGVLNITPDSFFDGGRYFDSRMAVQRGLEMLAAGADIIDVGGESTRPGSVAVDAGEEMDRVVPVIEELHRLAPEALISIDTNKAVVAARALGAGAAVVNDISGLTFDPLMAETVAGHDAGLVLMHIQNRPLEMQRKPEYRNVVEEVFCFLDDALSRAETSGVAVEKIAVDPGIGFGKTLAHNLALLNRLDNLHRLGRPVLVGLSRKSFIGALLGVEPEKRLAGSLGAAVAAALWGAHILRVHDVEESVSALKMADAISAGAVYGSGEQ